MVQQLLDVVDLSGYRLRVRAHFLARKITREADIGRWLVHLIGECRIVGMNRRQKHIDAASARRGDQIVQQIDMLIDDEIAGSIGILPVAP